MSRRTVYGVVYTRPRHVGQKLGNNVSRRRFLYLLTVRVPSVIVYLFNGLVVGFNKGNTDIKGGYPVNVRGVFFFDGDLVNKIMPVGHKASPFLTKYTNHTIIINACIQ